MASWIYDEKFPTGMQFLFGTSSFIAAHDDYLKKKVVHDDDLENSAQQ
jgi:hypothetical protein